MDRPTVTIDKELAEAYFKLGDLLINYSTSGVSINGIISNRDVVKLVLNLKIVRDEFEDEAKNFARNIQRCNQERSLSKKGT